MRYDEPEIGKGEFRSDVDVSKEEVLRGAEDSLKAVEYQLLVPDYIGFVRPDFHARREEGDVTYEIVGVASSGLEDAVECLTKLAATKAFLGNKPDYVLVLPPINPHLFLEFFQEGGGRIYHGIQEQSFHVWTYSDVGGIGCWVGGSRDHALTSRFPKMSEGNTMQIRISQMMALSELEAEEEELRKGH